MMTSKVRFLAALSLQKTDCLPVTTHHLMTSYLEKYENGLSMDGFFDKYGMDPIRWLVPHTFDATKGDYFDPTQSDPGFMGSRRIVSDNWRISSQELPGGDYRAVRHTIHTPGGDLSIVLESNEHTTWVTEHLLKDKKDIELVSKYTTAPLCDVAAVNAAADEYGERGMIRGHICCFEFSGQPGCWQDACCLYGTEYMIMACYDDPEWVHELLAILQKRKMIFIDSLKGAKYDLLELGGGDGCLSLISPDIFNEFVAPYDAPLIQRIHDAGQRITYHLCGKKMGILSDVAAMKPDAIETFTPEGMGGDVVLKEAKRIVGDKCAMIGGFDQFHFFTGCTEQQTRTEVRRCFEATNGIGYILCPSDHFFEAEEKLLYAFADEARKCH